MRKGTIMIEKIDRIAIAVNDLEQATKFFSELLGVDFDVVGQNEQLGMRGSYSACGLELLAATNANTPVGKFLKQRGEGLWGIVFKVRDMEEAVKRFKEKGLQVAGDVTFGTMREVAFHPKDSFGVEIILAQYPEKHPATIAAWSEAGQVPIHRLTEEEG
jgi:methylmalonyl-CoA/ethylmalonyl-CoA epimerase